MREDPDERDGAREFARPEDKDHPTSPVAPGFVALVRLLNFTKPQGLLSCPHPDRSWTR